MALLSITVLGLYMLSTRDWFPYMLCTRVKETHPPLLIPTRIFPLCAFEKLLTIIIAEMIDRIYVEEISEI